MDPIVAELVDSFTTKADPGAPEPPRNVTTSMACSKHGDGTYMLVQWEPDKESAAKFYEILLLINYYDNECQDSFLTFRKVYYTIDTIAFLPPHSLNHGALYADPKQDTFHFVLVAGNKNGKGKPKYFTGSPLIFNTKS